MLKNAKSGWHRPWRKVLLSALQRLLRNFQKGLAETS